MICETSGNKLKKYSDLSFLQNNFWEVSGIYLSSSLKKYHQKYQECRFYENWPPCWSRLLAPLSCLPWGSKIILGGFWHLSQLKFKEISPKIPRMKILRKLAPLRPPPPCCPPIPRPPGPPGVQKIFREGSGMCRGARERRYRRTYQECKF